MGGVISKLCAGGKPAPGSESKASDRTEVQKGSSMRSLRKAHVDTTAFAGKPIRDRGADVGATSPSPQQAELTAAEFATPAVLDKKSSGSVIQLCGGRTLDSVLLQPVISAADLEECRSAIRRLSIESVLESVRSTLSDPIGVQGLRLHPTFAMLLDASHDCAQRDDPDRQRAVRLLLDAALDGLLVRSSALMAVRQLPSLHPRGEAYSKLLLVALASRAAGRAHANPVSLYLRLRKKQHSTKAERDAWRDCVIEGAMASRSRNDPRSVAEQGGALLHCAMKTLELARLKKWLPKILSRIDRSVRTLSAVQRVGVASFAAGRAMHMDRKENEWFGAATRDQAALEQAIFGHVLQLAGQRPVVLTPSQSSSAAPSVPADGCVRDDAMLAMVHAFGCGNLGVIRSISGVPTAVVSKIEQVQRKLGGTGSRHDNVRLEASVWPSVLFNLLLPNTVNLRDFNAIKAALGGDAYKTQIVQLRSIMDVPEAV